MEPFSVPLWFLYAVPTPLTVVAIVQATLPRRNALRAVFGGLAGAAASGAGRRVLALGIGVLLVNSAQSILDPGVTDWLGYDLTARVRGLEGDWIERVQAPILGLGRTGAWVAAALLTFAYVCAYPAFLVAPLFVYSEEGNPRGVAEHALGFAANYLLALPFYFFVPVAEVAWSGLSDAAPLMERVFAGISAQMRYESALDNCFPSLHVSCVTTALWFALKHGNRRLAAIGWAVWGLTVYGVMALGVHWGLDVAAGLPFGVLCAVLGTAVADRLRLGP